MNAFINTGNKIYNGRLPAFYDNKVCQPLTNLLIKNTPLIIEEWESYLEQKQHQKKLFFLYNETGWSTIMLYSYGLRYHKNCHYFSKTLDVLKPFEQIVTIYFSTLQPNTKLKPHYGDTDVTYRIHLGLDIPDGLPACGIEVGGVQNEWQTGKVFIFNDAHFHTAWNLTDKQRTVLIIDVIKPEFVKKKHLIISKILGAMSVGRIFGPIGLLDKPTIIIKPFHCLANIVFIILLPFQRALKYLY